MTCPPHCGPANGANVGAPPRPISTYSNARPTALRTPGALPTLTMLLAAGALALALPSSAHADEKLARARHCFACHQFDKKTVGPAYRDIAARYRGDALAEARLAQKIREGGAGSWGTLAMAPNPALTETESRVLARWVLSLAR